MVRLDCLDAGCCIEVRRCGDQRCRARVSRDANVLENERAEQEVDRVRERIEGADAQACRNCQSVEAVVQIDIRHRHCARSQRRADEVNVVTLFLGRLHRIRLDGRVRSPRNQAG